MVLKYLTTGKEDTPKEYSLFQLLSVSYRRYKLKTMAMCNLLILKEKTCPVFSYTYKPLDFFNEKMGHPNIEDAYLIEFKGIEGIFEKGSNNGKKIWHIQNNNY